jgi:type VI secretion system protein ImpJ
MTNNKPLWFEGMFMRPQHFQQNDRHWNARLENRLGGLATHGWGMRQLAFDDNMLALGKLSVTAVSAILPDGTPIEAPKEADLPAVREIGRDSAGRHVFLALAALRGDEPDINLEEQRSIVARYNVANAEVRDSTAAGSEPVEMRVGRAALRLVIEGEGLDDMITLPIARIRAINPTGAIELDDDFLPPSLTCAADTGFTSFLTEIEALLRRRGETLAAQTDPSRAEGLSDLLDFLLLQTVNRNEALFRHMVNLEHLHPERAYAAALALAGDLSTFMPDRRPGAFLDYDHGRPAACFPPVLDAIRRALSVVSERPAVQLPMEERKYGIRISIIGDRTLLDTARFVLSVRADVATEQLTRTIPKQIKIGPVEEIRNLVSVQLPGIALKALPVAPRAIPYYSGAAYFELDRSSDFWAKMASSVAFAFHVAGEYPGLRFEFWAIRET